jgi:hypothetical protein
LLAADRMENEGVPHASSNRPAVSMRG